MRRTHQPVRKHSYLKGREAPSFRQKITKQEGRAIYDAAENYDAANKKAGDRKGPLGPVGLQLLRYLTRLAVYGGGRLDPSYAHLMAKLNRSRDAIHRALNALRRAGFLDWVRRYAPTGRTDGGPKVEQCSNLYRLSLPAAAAALKSWFSRPAPTPDDFAHAKEARAAQLREQAAHGNGVLGALGLWASRMVVPDTAEGEAAFQAYCEAVKRRARKVSECESDQRTESPLIVL